MPSEPILLTTVLMLSSHRLFGFLNVFSRQMSCSLSPRPSCKSKQKQSSPSTRHGGAWGERRYSSYSFSTSALDGGEWSASRPGRAFTPGTQCTGGWVGLRAGLDTEDRGKILCPRRGSSPDRPVVQPVVRHYTSCLYVKYQNCATPC
jgi:hypothetical protein